MPAFDALLILAAAVVIGTLGALHLLYTFHGTKLHPRDPALIARMREVSPVLTRETTMWKTWIGFNASHSMAALLFAAVYGYLALAHGAMLFSSAFLLGLGLSTLLAFLVLGKLYWFRIPFTGIAIALACYIASVVLALADWPAGG